jgi:hypothetical protein
MQDMGTHMPMCKARFGAIAAYQQVNKMLSQCVPLLLLYVL